MRKRKRETVAKKTLIAGAKSYCVSKRIIKFFFRFIYQIINLYAKMSKNTQEELVNRGLSSLIPMIRRPVAPRIARGKLTLAFLRFLHPPRDYRDFYVT